MRFHPAGPGEAVAVACRRPPLSTLRTALVNELIFLSTDPAKRGGTSDAIGTFRMK